MSNDDYVIVSATFQGMAPSGLAFFIETAKGERRSIPRSLIHAADDGKLTTYVEDDEITFRLRRWKAVQFDLADEDGDELL